MDKIDKLKELFVQGQSLIGKRVRNGPVGSYTKISEVCIVLTEKQADERSFSVQEEFRKTGFCVALRSQGGGSSFPLLDATEVFQEEVTIKLTSDYDAVVSKDCVKVGCQTISKDKIIEVYNAITTFK